MSEKECGCDKEACVNPVEGCDCNKENCKDNLCDSNNRCEINVKKDDVKYFCLCGLSQDKPFCDGSHILTDCKNRIEVFKEDKTIHICNCGKTEDKPFCDGSCGKEEK